MHSTPTVVWADAKFKGEPHTFFQYNFPTDLTDAVGRHVPVISISTMMPKAEGEVLHDLIDNHPHLLNTYLHLVAGGLTELHIGRKGSEQFMMADPSVTDILLKAGTELSRTAQPDPIIRAATKELQSPTDTGEPRFTRFEVYSADSWTSSSSATT
jgi:hypothetical protein